MMRIKGSLMRIKGSLMCIKGSLMRIKDLLMQFVDKSLSDIADGQTSPAHAGYPAAGTLIDTRGGGRAVADRQCVGLGARPSAVPAGDSSPRSAPSGAPPARNDNAPAAQSTDNARRSATTFAAPEATIQ